MSGREAMTQKLVDYHNQQARGASFEWHARCATHVENQEQIIKALADALAELKNRATSGGMLPGYHKIIINGEERERMRAALRLVGRIP